jgi:hypothetical protein
MGRLRIGNECVGVEICDECVEDEKNIVLITALTPYYTEVMKTGQSHVKIMHVIGRWGRCADR